MKINNFCGRLGLAFALFSSFKGTSFVDQLFSGDIWV